MSQVRQEDVRMLGLDAFRGLACAAVLIYHYMHFVHAGQASAAAFAPALHGFYLHGWLGVDSFFCLSGFIFGKLYGDRISAREVSARGFFIARLSRLYPMFIVTLIPSAILLALFAEQSGTHFLHQDHDTAPAFIGELFLVRQWFTPFFAFNRSAWSISIEVLMYGLFYLSRRALPTKSLLIPVGLVLLAVGFRYVLYMPVIRGLFGFFLGVAAFEGMRWFERVRWKHGRALGGGILAGAMIVSVIGCGRSMDWNVEEWKYSTIFAADLGFTALIVLASKAKFGEGRFAALCAYAGELSYPAYLVHFPLQVAIVIAASWLGVVLPAEHAWFWFAYMTLVVAVAAVAHQAWEIPVRQWIRQRLRFSARPVAVG